MGPAEKVGVLRDRLFTDRDGGYPWDRPRKSWVQKLLVDGRSYDVWGFLYVGSRVWGFLYSTKRLRPDL